MADVKVETAWWVKKIGRKRTVLVDILITTEIYRNKWNRENRGVKRCDGSEQGRDCDGAVERIYNTAQASEVSRDKDKIYY